MELATGSAAKQAKEGEKKEESMNAHFTKLSKI
jgi:hypothetical protein